VSLYQSPPPNTHVICVDEMGPTAAKTYPAARWRATRPAVAPDYGRRGNVWTFGAFEPQTGQAFTACAEGRTSAHFITFDLRSVVESHRTMVENLALVGLERALFHRRCSDHSSHPSGNGLLE
jgi:hypothetical protein